jgi:FdhD protein
MENENLAIAECTRLNSGVEKVADKIIRETPLAIFVNGKYLTTAMVLATMPEEFVAGYLFGQGVINDISEVRSITVKNNRVAVSLSREAAAVNPARMSVQSDLKVSLEAVFKGVRATLKSDIFAVTEAVHSAGLFQENGETICLAEDIGRHNALDKVIGYGLIHHIDFSRVFAASTGRQPAEMILKCCRVNLPLIATKGVPTSLAVDMAQKAGITIAGLVRGETMTVYSNPERIAL